MVPPLRRAGRLAALVSLAGIGVALVAAVRLVTGLWLARAALAAHGGSAFREATLTVPWLAQAGPVPLATAGVYVDALAAVMATLVTLVAALVQLYSLGYLADEPRPALGRYYLYQSLFAFSMLGLVFAPNFLQLFVFWELVGLCSYLLIGFYYQRPAAARAAVKAFWVTKLGDVGFLLGIVLLWGATGTFEFDTLFRAVAGGALPASLALCMTLIYLGAVGKSAQFPLHVWLPDAMEGPTPVSALIHAATMVTAGVFLVARAYPLFQAVPWVLLLIAYVGAFTALLAATLALGESDLKRVLAYSTVSQLGYMMTALGAGALAAGVLHLLLHGFFKALLFLAAGAVIHAVHTNDMGAMGRLGRAMPKTAIVFVVGDARARGRAALLGLRLEGGDPRRRLGGGPPRALRAPVRHGVPDGVLHVPGGLPDVLRRPRRGRPPARPAGRHDGPALAPGGAVDRGHGARRGGARPDLPGVPARRGPRDAPARAGLAHALLRRARARGARPGLARLPAADGLGPGAHAGARALAGLGGAGLRARRALRGRLPGRRPRRSAGPWGGSTGTWSTGWSTSRAPPPSGRARSSDGSRPAAPRTTSTA